MVSAAGAFGLFGIVVSAIVAGAAVLLAVGEPADEDPAERGQRG